MYAFSQIMCLGAYYYISLKVSRAAASEQEGQRIFFLGGLEQESSSLGHAGAVTTAQDDASQAREFGRGRARLWWTEATREGWERLPSRVTVPRLLRGFPLVERAQRVRIHRPAEGLELGLSGRERGGLDGMLELIPTWSCP